MTLERINELRLELAAECISYGELYEIQCAVEAAGIKIDDDDPRGIEDQLNELEALLV